MKLVTFTDNNGFNHKSLIRDGDSDPSIGLIQTVPDLTRLDWDDIAKTIHNKLVERELFTLADIQNRSVEFNQVIMATVVKPIFALYQEIGEP